MKILHTSDWHLGHSLKGYDRQFEHQCFLDWLAIQILDQAIDVLLITGDIFDNANPSAASQKMFYRFLQSVHVSSPHLQMVMIAGNHDSPGRLEAPSPLLDLFNTTVVGQTTRTPEGAVDLDALIVPLYDSKAEVHAWCIAIPFLRPGDVPSVDNDADGYLAGVEALYQFAFERALEKRQPGQAIVAMGHCHLNGAKVSEDSERRIVIGGLEALSPALFDARIAYAALGHLHLPQCVGGNAWVRYSGSPLPLSFSEIDYAHQVLCVELEGESLASVTPVQVPRVVELMRVPASPAPLAEVLAALEALRFPEPELPETHWPYLEVRVLFDTPEPGARAAIESALKDKPLRLAGIDVRYQRTHEATGNTWEPGLGDLNQLQPDDVLKRHYRSRYSDELPPDLLQAFQTLVLETGVSA